MGVIKNIGINEFPKQGSHLNMPVRVFFKYDTSNYINGIMVRDDIEDPFQSIIKLEDGRFILTTECQYQIL